MPSKPSKPAKPAKRVTIASQTAAASTSNTAPPAPFTPAPTCLAPIAEYLDRKAVYITHIDTHPRLYKRRIFLIPIVLNLLFAILILLRLYYAIPKYLSILAATFGLGGEDAVDTKSATWGRLIGLVAKRGLMLGGDWVLLRIVGSWPYTFFFEGPENACTWRWKCGFRDREVNVRVGRRWGAEELMRGSRKGQESPYWKTRVLPAVDQEWVKAKTGYLMMGRDWDLDFPGMVAAQKLVDGKEVREEDVDGVVLAWNGKSEIDGEWVSWRYGSSSPQAPVKAAADATIEKDEYGQTEDEGTRQMVMVRDKLAGMGKEELFFRMIELAQYEWTVPGRSRQEREKATLEETQKLFKSNGVDFGKLMQELELDWPGLEKPT